MEIQAGDKIISSCKKRKSLAESISNFFREKFSSEKKNSNSIAIHPVNQKYIRLTKSSSQFNKENKFVKERSKKLDVLSQSYPEESFKINSCLKKFNTDPALTENKKSANFCIDCEVIVFNDNIIDHENESDRHKEKVNFDLSGDQENITNISDSTDELNLDKDNSIRKLSINSSKRCKRIWSLEIIPENDPEFARGKHAVFSSVGCISESAIPKKLEKNKKRSEKVKNPKSKSDNKSDEQDIFNYMYSC